MTAARDEVLARLRAACVAGRPSSPIAVPRGYRHVGRSAPGAEETLALLAETLTDYRATVHRVAGDAAIGAAVWDALSPLSTDRLTRVVVPPGVPWAWFEPGRLTLPGTGLDGRVDDPPLTVAELDGVDVVVTGAAVAIADTGTFVLDAAAPDQGRRALTLVPDHHVCVIRAADVVASVPEAIARLDPARPLTFVSGPSATSDIELDRVEGVHGPRRLDVVLVGPDDSL